MKLLVVGGGGMGFAIATALAKRHEVFLFEKETKRRLEISCNIDSDITLLSELTEVSEVDICFEAVTENLITKKRVFKELEHAFSNTVICTNTSSFTLEQLSASMKNPERLIATHFFTPADLIPIVEVMSNPKVTNKESLNLVNKVLKDIEKYPIQINKDYPGLVGNRLQAAIMREALFLIEEDVISIEDLDMLVRWSLGIRLVTNGLFLQRDINGLDIHYEVTKSVYPTLANNETVSSLLLTKIEQNERGMKDNRGFYEWTESSKKEYLAESEKMLSDIMTIIKGEKNND